MMALAYPNSPVLCRYLWKCMWWTMKHMYIQRYLPQEHSLVNQCFEWGYLPVLVIDQWIIKNTATTTTTNSNNNKKKTKNKQKKKTKKKLNKEMKKYKWPCRHAAIAVATIVVPCRPCQLTRLKIGHQMKPTGIRFLNENVNFINYSFKGIQQIFSSESQMVSLFSVFWVLAKLVEPMYRMVAAIHACNKNSPIFKTIVKSYYTHGYQGALVTWAQPMKDDVTL